MPAAFSREATSVTTPSKATRRPSTTRRDRDPCLTYLIDLRRESQQDQGDQFLYYVKKLQQRSN